MTTLLGLMITSNATATLEALSHVKMGETGWGRGWGRQSRCRAVDELSVEFILNSTEAELRGVRNVGPHRVNYIKDCLTKLLPESMLAQFPLFNSVATPLPTSAHKAREAEAAARRAAFSNALAAYGLDVEDDDE